MTTYDALRTSDEIREIIDNDMKLPVMRDAIDAVLPNVLKKQSDRNYLLYLEAFQRALYPELSAEACKVQPLPDFNSVIALFPCLFCSGYPVERNYALSELSRHIKEKHLSPGQSDVYWWTLKGLESIRFHTNTVRQALTMLGLPEDTHYEAVSGKVVCLCGDPSFEQPAQFSALVRCRRIMNNTVHSSTASS